MKIAYISAAFGENGPEQCALYVESAKRVGVEVLLYGVGQPWAGHTDSKFRGAVEFARELTGKGYTHVCYVDGFDSLMVRDPARFFKQTPWPAPPAWWFSTEENCWPDASQADQYEQKQTPWPYLNAGAWLSDIHQLLRVGPWMLTEMHDDDDQRMLTKAYLGGLTFGKLDQWCRLFQSMGGPAAVKHVHYRQWSSCVLNSYTGTAPSILHYNGRSGGREEMWKEVRGRE